MRTTTKTKRLADVIGVALDWQSDPDTDGLVVGVADRRDLDAYRSALDAAGYETSWSKGNVGQVDEGRLYLWVR